MPDRLDLALVIVNRAIEDNGSVPGQFTVDLVSLVERIPWFGVARLNITTEELIYFAGDSIEPPDIGLMTTVEVDALWMTALYRGMVVDSCPRDYSDSCTVAVADEDHELAVRRRGSYRTFNNPDLEDCNHALLD